MDKWPKSPKPDDRLVPAQEENEESKPNLNYPFADRIDSKGERTMHPLKSLAALFLLLPTLQALPGTLYRAGEKGLKDIETSQVIKSAEACTGHFSGRGWGYCVTAKDKSLLLTVPVSKDEIGDRLTVEDLINTAKPADSSVTRIGNNKLWLVTLSARDKYQLADWIEAIHRKQKKDSADTKENAGE